MPAPLIVKIAWETRLVEAAHLGTTCTKERVSPPAPKVSFLTLRVVCVAPVHRTARVVQARFTTAWLAKLDSRILLPAHQQTQPNISSS
jgi:hypothetical protein